MFYKKAKFALISFLLTSCGGSGGSSGVSDGGSSQIATRTYQMDQGGSDWFSSKWAYIDGSGSVGQSYQDSSIRPDEDVSGKLIKVIIAADSTSVPKQVTIKKDSDFSLKIPSLAIAKDNKLILDGTKGSSVKIGILPLQGELKVSSGEIELTGNIEVSKEGSIVDQTASKNGIVFKTSDGQKGKMVLDGTYDGNLTLPEDFTLKTSLGGKVTGDLISNGILQLTGGKTFNVGGSFVNNGDVIIDLSDQSPSATPLLKAVGKIDLQSGNITIKGGKKGWYTIFSTDDKIVSKPGNLTVGNGEKIAQDAKTYRLEVTNPSAAFMERQFHKFNLNGAMNDYVSYLRTSGMFDANMNQGRVHDLSFVSKKQDQQFFYGVTYQNKCGVYADYSQGSYLSAGIYSMSSFYGLDFINLFRGVSYGVNDRSILQSMNGNIFELDSSLSKKINISSQTRIVPSFSLLYSKILSLSGEFVHQNRLFTAQANQRGDFNVKAGVDMVSVMNIKSVACEAFMSLDISNKGYDKISFVSGDISIVGSRELSPSMRAGINAAISQDSKMYVRTKIQSEKSLFEMGLNIKL